MKSKIEIIADCIVDSFKDTIKLVEKEIKDDSFKLVFSGYSYSIILSCSLHHLDTPWEIVMYIKDGSTKISVGETLKGKSHDEHPYEITPLFLSEVENNAKGMAEKMRIDLFKAIELLQGEAT